MFLAFTPKSSYVFSESELKIASHALDLVQYAIKTLLKKKFQEKE